jgi:multiple sugar transport system permease protein
VPKSRTILLLGAVAIAIVVVLLFPIAWMLSTAIKPHGEVFAYPPVWIPTHITFEAFALRGDMRPLPAGISMTFLQEFQYQWPEMMAVATVATLPILALFVAFQHNFIEGVTAGAVKQ